MDKVFKTLNETELRKPEFDPESAPIELFDGQVWYFPRPVLSGVYPVFRNDEFQSRATFNWGEAFGKIVDEYFDGGDDTTIVKLAWHMLSRNYNLEPNDLSGLLFRPMPNQPRFEESKATYRAIWDLVMGKAPKATPVGSDSA